MTSLGSLSYAKKWLDSPILSQKRKPKPREGKQIMPSVCRVEQSRDKQEILWCGCRVKDKWPWFQNFHYLWAPVEGSGMTAWSQADLVTLSQGPYSHGYCYTVKAAAGEGLP